MDANVMLGPLATIKVILLLVLHVFIEKSRVTFRKFNISYLTRMECS